jgi:hypothetical protein
MSWIEKGVLNEDAGDVGGDDQIGPAFARRFVNPDLPGRLVTVCTYVVRDDMDIRNGEWDVEEQIEYLICADMSDPGGTETWSEYSYERGTLDGRVRHSFEAAQADAREHIGRISPSDFYGWDGKEFRMEY